MEDIYQNYFKSMPCFVSVQNRDLRIVAANKKFVDNFGDYEGRFCYQVYKQRPEKCEDCPVERTFRDGRPYQSDELIKTIDGNEVCVLVNTTPIYDDDGKITAVMEMSTDITDLKLLHNQLRESQERYRLLFEEVPCYISIQDKNLRIVDANRMHREAFGTSYGSKCYEVYKHRAQECMPCPVRETFKDGEIRTHEEVVTAKDRRRINVLVMTAPIRDADGRIEKVVEMSADITQIRELQDKLTSVGLLISSISHGIKGLLNGLDGGIYLINTGLKKDDRSRIDKGWDIALRNVRRIRSMVMDILYYAKDREPMYEKIEVTDLARDIFNMMHERAQKMNIDLTCDIADDAGEMEADRQMIRSLLINLLENSIDACRIDKQKTDHSVSLGVKSNTDNIIFEVADDGIGMDQETREKAFSLFFSSKGAGGTGLGLFISNKIARTHGGRIKVVSEEGQGAHFMVEIPRQKADIAAGDKANTN
jgi:PAS domain S-box-containing protein